MRCSIVFTHGAIVVPPAEFPDREVGASVEFHGIVREMEDGRALTGLFYEAHVAMAVRLLARHFQEVQAVHAVASVEFIHRLGWVPVGESSLWMRVLSAHRGEALAFLSEAVIRLKKDVPVWKMTQAPA